MTNNYKDITVEYIKGFNHHNLGDVFTNYLEGLASLIGDNVHDITTVKFYVNLEKNKFVLGYNGHEGFTSYEYDLTNIEYIFDDALNKGEKTLYKEIITGKHTPRNKREHYLKGLHSLSLVLKRVLEELVESHAINLIKTGGLGVNYEMNFPGQGIYLHDVSKRLRNKASTSGGTKSYRKILGEIAYTKQPELSESEPLKNLGYVKALYAPSIDRLTFILPTNNGRVVIEQYQGIVTKPTEVLPPAVIGIDSRVLGLLLKSLQQLRKLKV